MLVAQDVLVFLDPPPSCPHVDTGQGEQCTPRCPFPVRLELVQLWLPISHSSKIYFPNMCGFS